MPVLKYLDVVTQTYKPVSFELPQSAPVHISYHLAVAQAAAAATEVTVVFDTALVADTANFSYASGVFTVKTPGLYKINAQIAWTSVAGAASQYRVIKIHKNGVSQVQNQLPGHDTQNVWTAVEWVARLAANDTISIIGRYGGTTTTISGVGSGALAYTSCQLTRLGP